MTQSSDDSQAFLRTFFGSGNSIQWDAYEDAAPTDAIRSYLEPWVRRFFKQESPFVLPRVDPSSKRTSWYVLCGNSREARSMRESLLAFIGPTYSSFHGEMAKLDLDDPIENCCQSTFGSLVFRLPVIHNDDRTKVGRLLTSNQHGPSMVKSEVADDLVPPTSHSSKYEFSQPWRSGQNCCCFRFWMTSCKCAVQSGFLIKSLRRFTGNTSRSTNSLGMRPRPSRPIAAPQNASKTLSNRPQDSNHPTRSSLRW